MPDNGPLVSICLPTYNAGATIGRTLDSILCQTYRTIEIIVSDNASTDNTLDVVAQYPDPRIRVIRNETNVGAENNWNCCIREANGEYIAIFHADDTYCPDIIEQEIAYFAAHPGIGAVFTSGYHIDANDVRIGHHRPPFHGRDFLILTLDSAFPLVLEHYNFFLCPSAMVKSGLYRELMPFRYSRYGTSSDLDMWLRILEKAPVLLTAKRLMNYRINVKQGGFIYNYMRTGRADFFTVTDDFFKRHPEIRIPPAARTWYRYYELGDLLIRAKSCIAMNRPDESRSLLKEFVSPVFLKPFGEHFSLSYARIWLVGMGYLAAVTMFPGMLSRLVPFLIRRNYRSFYS